MDRVLFALTSLWAFLRREDLPFATENVADFPEDPKPCVVYLVGERYRPWAAALLCPCGCGELIQLSILPRGSPRWVITKHVNGTTTLHPSVRRIVGCRSHFFLRRSRVAWALPIGVAPPSHS
jgi:hypothetical protein